MGKHNNLFEWLQNLFQGKNLYLLYIFVCDILYISIIRVDALNLLNWIRMCFYVSYGLTCGQKIKKYSMYCTYIQRSSIENVSLEQFLLCSVICEEVQFSLFSRRQKHLVSCCYYAAAITVAHSDTVLYMTQSWVEQYYEMYEMTKIHKDKLRIHTVYY